MSQSIPMYEMYDANAWNGGQKGGVGSKTPAEGSAIHVRGAHAPKSAGERDADAQAAQLLTAQVRGAQAGDAKSLCALIESNRAWIRGIAYAVLGDAHLAEDAAQDVCVRMVKHLHGLDAPEAFRPWLYRMTRNVALSLAQRRERAPQPLGLDAEQMAGEIQISRDDPPGAALEAEERYNVVLETIQRLPHIYREVLVLKHVRNMSYAEMSAILGVNIKSLEVRLVRARKLLQVRLGRRFERRRTRDARNPGRSDNSGGGGISNERRASG